MLSGNLDELALNICPTLSGENDTGFHTAYSLSWKRVFQARRSLEITSAPVWKHFDNESAFLSGEQQDFYLQWIIVNQTDGDQLEFLKEEVYKDLNARQGEAWNITNKQKTQSRFGYLILKLKSSVPTVTFTMLGKNSLGVFLALWLRLKKNNC